MEISDYLRVVRLRWRLVLLTVLIVLLVVDVLNVVAKPEFVSSARLFVSTTDRSASEALDGASFASQRVSSYAGMVGGRKLATRVSNNLGGKVSPTVVSQKVTATVVPETVIVDISARYSDPKTAQALAQATATGLAAMIKQLETQQGQQDAPIKATVLDPAGLPLAPVSPQSVRNVAIGILLGLVLGVALAIVRDLLDTRIYSQGDVERAADIPVLARILLNGPGAHEPLVTTSAPRSDEAEAFRILRTNLQFDAFGEGAKVIVVTSPVADDRKTWTANNLALAMQSGGQRTLLLVGDLRTPNLPLLVKPKPVGLTSVLEGNIELADAIQVHELSGLSVLTRGPLKLPNSADLLQPLAIQRVLEAARRQFETVIIDSPPLLPYSDSALIAAQSDGVLIVVQCGKSSRDQLKECLERLGTVNARVLGVSLNIVGRRRRRERAFDFQDGNRVDDRFVARPSRQGLDGGTLILRPPGRE